MITGFALPTSAARSPAGTLADPTARGRRLNVWDIRACPDRPGSDQTICRSLRFGTVDGDAGDGQPEMTKRFIGHFGV